MAAILSDSMFSCWIFQLRGKGAGKSAADGDDTGGLSPTQRIYEGIADSFLNLTADRTTLSDVTAITTMTATVK